MPGQQPLLTALQATGLMVQLPANLPVHELLAIGDALLAAPLLLVAIPLHGVDALATLSEFDQRFGANLVGGMSGVTALAPARDALWAGARFLITPGLHPPLIDFAQRYNLPCLPHLQTIGDLQRYAQTKCPLALATPALLQQAPTLPLAPSRFIARCVDEASVATAAQLGMGALDVTNFLFPTAAWSHAQLITQARRLRATWANLISENRPNPPNPRAID